MNTIGGIRTLEPKMEVLADCIQSVEDLSWKIRRQDERELSTYQEKYLIISVSTTPVRKHW